MPLSSTEEIKQSMQQKSIYLSGLCQLHFKKMHSAVKNDDMLSCQQILGICLSDSQVK